MGGRIWGIFGPRNHKGGYGDLRQPFVSWAVVRLRLRHSYRAVKMPEPRQIFFQDLEHAIPRGLSLWPLIRIKPPDSGGGRGAVFLSGFGGPFKHLRVSTRRVAKV